MPAGGIEQDLAGACSEAKSDAGISRSLRICNPRLVFWRETDCKAVATFFVIFRLKRKIKYPPLVSKLRAENFLPLLP